MKAKTMVEIEIAVDTMPGLTVRVEKSEKDEDGGGDVSVILPGPTGKRAEYMLGRCIGSRAFHASLLITVSSGLTFAATGVAKGTS